MNWKKVCISTTEEAMDIVSSILMDAGAGGVEVNGGELPKAHQDEYLAPPDSLEGVLTVCAYYGEDGFEEVLAVLLEKLDMLKAQNPDEGTLELSVQDIADTDWNENFKKHFTTFRAAGCFVVKPTWEDLISSPGDIVIEIDPGMAFGSGVHETTRMCLELLQKYMPPKASVLDVGCGSGILGIGAAKLGAQKVLALDYDKVSVGVARDNAAHNRVSVMEVRHSDLLQNADGGPYDLILANIIADIVIRLNKDVDSVLAEDGVYVMSGIIDERLEDVIASLEQNGFTVVETLSMADWRAVAARRTNASVLR